MVPYLNTGEPFTFDRQERVMVVANVSGVALRGNARRRQFDFAVAYEEESPEVREITGGNLVERKVGLWVIVLEYVVVWLGSVIAWQWKKCRVISHQ